MPPTAPHPTFETLQPGDLDLELFDAQTPRNVQGYWDDQIAEDNRLYGVDHGLHAKEVLFDRPDSQRPDLLRDVVEIDAVLETTDELDVPQPVSPIGNDPSELDSPHSQPIEFLEPGALTIGVEDEVPQDDQTTSEQGSLQNPITDSTVVNGFESPETFAPLYDEQNQRAINDYKSEQHRLAEESNKSAAEDVGIV